MHILWKGLKYQMDTRLLRSVYLVPHQSFCRATASPPDFVWTCIWDGSGLCVCRVWDCPVVSVCVSMRGFISMCVWLPVGWECSVGILQAPCCSQNICLLCVTNQSQELEAVTNQAAWWSFHGILGWSWNKGRHRPPHFPLLPTPFRLWYLRPPHGEITSPSIHNPTDHGGKMTSPQSDGTYESLSVSLIRDSPVHPSKPLKLSFRTKRMDRVMFSVSLYKWYECFGDCFIADQIGY